MSASLLPAGTTLMDLYQLVLHRPIMMASTLGLKVDISHIKGTKEHAAEATRLYVEAVLDKLNEQYGFSFVSPYAAVKVTDASKKLQSLAEKTESATCNACALKKQKCSHLTLPARAELTSF